MLLFFFLSFFMRGLRPFFDLEHIDCFQFGARMVLIQVANEAVKMREKPPVPDR